VPILYVIIDYDKEKLVNRMPFYHKLSVLAALLFLGGCGIIPGYGGYELPKAFDSKIYTYKLYPGKHLQEHEIAKVSLEDVDFAIIDGLSVATSDYQHVHLLPGKHRIRWGEGFHFSVMVEPSMYDEAEHEVEVNLLAGHTYKLYADRTTGHDYQFYFWIQDAETGEVIGGQEVP
jgi:hypothetical protein